MIGFIFKSSACCLPLIPEQGTVGASGDLAPLAHMVLGLMGEGDMWSPKTGVGKADEVSLSQTVFIEENNISP